MKKYTLPLAAMAALTLVALDSGKAQAQFGIHIGGRNAHIDIGNPHGFGTFGYRSYSAYRPAATFYHGSHRARYHHDWHDTSHWDYHPGGFVPHGNHLDYIPPSRVWHQDGHWDVHRGSHHRRHH